jgi:hypothetical protein
MNPFPCGALWASYFSHDKPPAETTPAAPAQTTATTATDVPAGFRKEDLEEVRLSRHCVFSVGSELITLDVVSGYSTISGGAE